MTPLLIALLFAQDANADILKSDDAYAKGELESALGHLDKALSADPNSLPAHLGRGRIFIDLGDWEKGRAAFGSALSVAAKDAGALVNRGRCHLELGKAEDAIADFNAALEVDPERLAAVLFRGLAQLAKGDAKAAEADLLRARRMKGSSETEKWLAARLLLAAGKTDEAYSRYLKIPRGTRGLHPAYRELVLLGRGGNVKYRNNTLEIGYLDDLVKWFPRELAFVLWRADAKALDLLKAGLAERDYTAYLETKGPEKGLAYRGRALARISAFSPNLPGALEDAAAALAVDPKDFHMLLLQGEGLIKTKQWADAEAAAGRALEVHPGHPAARLIQARAMEGRRDVAGSAALRLELAKLVPTNELPEPLASLPSGLRRHLDVDSRLDWHLRSDALSLLVKLERHAEVIPLAREIIEINYVTSKAWMVLAEALEFSGDAEGAAKTWADAAKDPKRATDGYFLGGRGAWHYRAGRKDEARVDLEAAFLKADSFNTSAFFGWALLHFEAQGRKGTRAIVDAFKKARTRGWPPSVAVEPILEFFVHLEPDPERVFHRIEQNLRLELRTLEEELAAKPGPVVATKVEVSKASMEASIKYWRSFAMYVFGRRCLIDGKADEARAWFEKSEDKEAKLELKRMKN